MDVKAVLVSVKYKGSPHSYEASGVLLNNKFILITGTIFIPFLHIPEQRKWVVSFINSSSSKLKTNKHINKILFRIFREDENNSTSNGLNDLNLIEQESKILGVWKCPLVSHSLEKLFYDWTLGHVNNNGEVKTESNHDTDMSKELMSILTILKCEGIKEQERRQQIHKSYDDMPFFSNLPSLLMEPNRGQEVEVVSTPFGNKLFVNSLSRGVISNVIGKEKCLILTDVRTVSGCEGGPIFIAKRSRSRVPERKLVGLVTCPLTWWRGEWVGLTVGISLVPVLRTLAKNQMYSVKFNETSSNISTSNLDFSPLQAVDEGVVLVRNGTSWGSGVVLDSVSGTVITCSHVVKNNAEIIVVYRGRRYPAVTIFKTRKNVAYDLAILKVQVESVFDFHIKFSEKPAQMGENVIAAGFPFFTESDDSNLRPSIVSGCIARVNSFMIQTTCCIQSGFSGGPILRDGKLLGIIVSNTRNVTAGAVFPHINFGIPSSVFQKPVEDYLKTKNASHLKVLESFDNKVQSIWALHTSKL